MPLIEAHIIIYSLMGIGCISLAIAGVYIVLEGIDMHRYFKASNYVIHMEMKHMKDEDRKELKKWQ